MLEGAGIIYFWPKDHVRKTKGWLGGGSKPWLSTRKPHWLPQPRGTGMQGIKGTLHNRGKNNKPQPRQRNENHVPRPLGRAPSTGTCFKELLLLQSSGINFLHMPSRAEAARAMLCNGVSSGAPGLGGTTPAQPGTAFPGAFGGLDAFLDGIWVISERFF